MHPRQARLLLAGFATFLATAAEAHSIYALVGGATLVRFDSAAPGTIDRTVAVTGLASGDNLVGMDFRPLDGSLLALGAGSRLYRIDLDSGVATQIGSDGAFTLSGTRFGMNINPNVDRVRIVSDLDQNFRINPDTGVIAGTDTALAYDALDTHSGSNPNVVAVAYSLNLPGSASTVLYDIDSSLDILADQAPANNGTLHTVGALGALTANNVGFDIYTPIGGGDTAYAALNVSGSTSGLYTVNLGSGAITFVGNIGAVPTLVRALAVPRDRIFIATQE